MIWILDVAFGLALLAVVVILGLGVTNLARGGGPARSQALMRARVAAQAVALVLFLAVLWAHGR